MFIKSQVDLNVCMNELETFRAHRRAAVKCVSAVVITQQHLLPGCVTAGFRPLASWLQDNRLTFLSLRSLAHF